MLPVWYIHKPTPDKGIIRTEKNTFILVMDIDAYIMNKRIRETILAMVKGNYITFIECRLDLKYLPVLLVF